MENERVRILFVRQKEQILAEVRSEIQKHELQAESDKRSIQELNGIIDSQRMEIVDFKKNDQNKNRDLRETRIWKLRDVEELQKSHVLKVEEFSRRKLTEDQKHDYGAKSQNSGITE